jgi:excisionase family DNA binding protein
MDERWLTVDDICKYLNAGNETLYKWIEQRTMPGHRRRRVFKQDSKLLIWYDQELTRMGEKP